VSTFKIVTTDREGKFAPEARYEALIVVEHYDQREGTWDETKAGAVGATEKDAIDAVIDQYRKAEES
jgi:hypothetical protein